MVESVRRLSVILPKSGDEKAAVRAKWGFRPGPRALRASSLRPHPGAIGDPGVLAARGVAAAPAAAVETLGRRLADAETLSPEERQRLSRQMATLRQQIAHPLVDPSWDPARAGIPPGTAGRNTP